jgi:hypothetical protein
MSKSKQAYPDTPDGRYFVVRGRLWRRSDPSLNDETRQRLVSEWVHARHRMISADRRHTAACRQDRIIPARM